jgi:TolA-binding protein
MRKLLLLALALLTLLVSGVLAQPAATSDKVRIEEAVLARWGRVSQLAVGDRARAWIDEGNLVLAQYRELVALDASRSGPRQGEINIEISKLKLRLIHLLRSIEEARLFDLDESQLRTLQREYEAERESLLKRRAQVRDTVLDKGERFLATYRRDRNLQRFSQRDVVAKLCLQLAELYYSRSEEHYFAAQDSLLARAERGLPTGFEPVKDFTDAVQKYQRVIDEFPYSDFMDDALYNVAYIRENSTNPVEVEESRRLYEHLVRDFPASAYAPEAWMRLGEYWFRQDGEEAIRQAIDSYAMILDYHDYPAREKALYKLGWCHYRLQEHETSVSYFVEAAKFAVRKQDVEEGLGADLLDESIAYIAVNYADPDWDQATVGGLTRLVADDGELRAGVGLRLMERYGDLFREETQDFPRAVAAYDSLLSLYADRPEAPFIQEKIIQCYAPGALADAQLAYQEKNELYERYAGEGPWRSDAETWARVEELLERHLEENVGIALDHAYATRHRADFDEYMLQSRRYLQSFPDDSSAYLIHWNLAKTLEAELQDHGTAYDEYLAISRGYPKRDRRDAAYNAIALSQILVDTEARGGPAPALPDSVGAMVLVPLTPMEEKKKEALANFVDLFPEDERAPGYRLLEGKLHYSHYDFAAATALFDSLIAAWPQAPEVGEAYQLKLESLFALGRFQEAEAIAREIQGMDLPADALARARQRQAESVYSFADGLRKAEDHRRAAEEFRRMALDVPDSPFADAALMDAGNEFSLAQDHASATETYLYLADHHPQSAYADQALSLGAFLCLNELKDQARAARTFERLAMEYPDSPYARSAISNAAWCYNRSEDWASTIRMNAIYVERYPEAEDASAVLFENAGLWLKLDNVTAANTIYADFAARYPDDPRTVQAYVERAEYLQRQRDEPAARAEYREAVERNRQLLRRGGAGNPLYASRALRKLVGWRFEDYQRLALHQPELRFEQDLADKKAARDGLLADLSELVQMGTGDVFYARYMIAATHEEFARAYREQERASWLTPEERLRSEVTIQDASHELARVAARSYIGTTQELDAAIESLRRQQRDLGRRRENLEAWLAAAPDSGGLSEDSLSQRLAILRAADLLDSSLTESTIWTSRSRERVPELILATLAIFEQRVDHALALRSQYRDDAFLRLADTDKNILGGTVMVALQGSLDAYREGLEIIGQVGLDRLWLPRVEQRLRLLVHKVPQAGLAFRREAAAEFDLLVDRFLATVDRGENYVDPAGLTEEDYGSDVLDMADFCQGYALSSLLLTERIIQHLIESGLPSSLGGELSDTLAAHALAWSVETKRRRDGLTVRKEDYWRRFEQSASYVHRDAHTTLDDASYFLVQTAREVLVQVEPAVSRTRAGSVPARRLLMALAEMDPAAFGDRFGLSEEGLVVRSGASWRVRRGYVEGFERPDHEESGWMDAQVVGRPALQGLLPGAAALWNPAPGRTLPPDTLSVPADSTEALSGLLAKGALLVDSLDSVVRLALPSQATVVAVADTLYFRHAFELAGTPVGANLQLAADDGFAIFFNGEYIDEQVGGDPNGQAAPTGLMSYELGEFLRSGSNLLAVEVRDRDGLGGGFVLELHVRQIARLTPEMLEAQIQRELEGQRKLDFQRKVSRIHVKNRID